jgi:hypothetical protein
VGSARCNVCMDLDAFDKKIAVVEEVRVSVNRRKRRPPIGISSRDRAISWDSRYPSTT